MSFFGHKKTSSTSASASASAAEANGKSHTRSESESGSSSSSSSSRGHVLTAEDIARDLERRVQTLAEALQGKVEENESLFQKLRESQQACKALQETCEASQRRIAEMKMREKKLTEDHAKDVVCYQQETP